MIVFLKQHFSGVIYLKNFITSNWADREAENAAVPFSIHEQDRAMIRDAIVDATVHAPELIRYFKLGQNGFKGEAMFSRLNFL